MVIPEILAMNSYVLEMARLELEQQSARSRHLSRRGPTKPNG